MSNSETEWVQAMALYHKLCTLETELIRSIQEKVSGIDSFEGRVEFAAGAMEMADRLAELRVKKLAAARLAAGLRKTTPAFQREPPA
jgi:hypothetical protein